MYSLVLPDSSSGVGEYLGSELRQFNHPRPPVQRPPCAAVCLKTIGIVIGLLAYEQTLLSPLHQTLAMEMQPMQPLSLSCHCGAARFWEFSTFSSTEMMFIVANANISTSFVFKCLSRRNSCICLTQRLMNFTIKAKSVHFLHSTAPKLVTIHHANTEQRKKIF